MLIKKSIAGIMTWLVAAVTGMVVIIIPLGFFLHAYQNTSAILETEADIHAGMIASIISSNPGFRKFEDSRISEYLAHRPKRGVAERRRLVNAKNEIVSQRVDDLPAPLIMRSSPILDSGIVAGRIEISRSLQPILKQTGLVFLLMFLMGLGVIFALRIIPARTIFPKKTALRNKNENPEAVNELLREEIVKCRKAASELSTRNETLERQVVEETLRLEAEIGKRLQAERILAESENNLRDFMENAPIGICLADLSGHVQFINRKIEESTGWTREEVLSQDAFTIGFFDEDTKRILLERLAARLKGDEPRTTEIPVICKDGSRLWINLKTTIVHKDGVPGGLQIAFIDVTDRKQAEESLRESEAKYKLLAEKMTDVVFITDLNLRTLYASPSIKAQLGFTPEERIAQDVPGQVTPASLAVALDLLSKEYEREQQGQADPDRTITVELEYYHKDGSTRWIENVMSGIRDDQGVAIGLHGVSRDITKRRKMEESLQESERKYRELVDSVPITLFEMDTEGKITSANPAALETFRYTPEDLEDGYNIEQLIIPEDMERLIVTVERVWNGEALWNLEFTGLRKDGSTFPFIVFPSAIIRDDKLIGIRGAMIDITQRKQAERDLQNARDMLLQSEKLASIGRLSAGVAHEILNPVNIISMELQILRTMDSLSPEVQEEIKVCMNQIGRIVTITENLKAFSRIPSKKMIMASINNVIKYILVLYATQLKIEGIETEVHYQYALPETLMDMEKIEQVIMNLISNAMASMEGKEKKILRITTQKEIPTGDHDQLSITIADTGTGIKRDVMSKIFDPFFTTKEPGKGTGLGLSISYGIIHDHGGAIRAENNEWGGASFHIRLPVKTDRKDKSLPI